MRARGRAVRRTEPSDNARHELADVARALDLLRAGSLVQVALSLSTRLEGGAAAAPAPAADTAKAQIERQVSNLSESEVDSILRAMLEAEKAPKEAAP